MTTNSSTKRETLSGNTHISLPVRQMQELDTILQKIMRNVCAFLEAQCCSIALLDAEQNKPVTLAVLQNQDHNPDKTPFHDSDIVTNWVAGHHKPLVINDVSNDSRFEFTDHPISGSVASVPLIDNDFFIGALTVTSIKTDAFGPHQMLLLGTFAEQIALAIINTYQAEIALQDVAHMKANFLSMITHELRSPLNSINGYLDLVLEGIAGKLNQQQHEFVQRARAGSEHLYALIEDLLLISRADAGQLRLNLEAISLPEVVANALEDLQLVALDNRISTTVQIDYNFPRVYADAVRLQQVLRNLISNALRFSPPETEIIISARIINNPNNSSSSASTGPIENQQLAEVQVRDMGHGIAPEYHERIFERFYQIPLVNAGLTSGQGLGLAIAKLIIELHGGQITVESMPGLGSIFKFTLPLVGRK
jgi:signal transduction histidine kinase